MSGDLWRALDASALAAGSDRWQLRLKRAADVSFAAGFLLFFAPLLLIIVAAIMLEDGGSPFFVQERTGLGQRRFLIYKFRTMRCAAAIRGGVASQPETTVAQAVQGDARVTRVGAVLRRLSWDEFPQLWNVLKGDMSLVGPRPHAVAHDRAWSDVVPNYADRFRMRPGLTGLAQIRGFRGEVSSLGDITQRVQADNAYIDSWRLWLDLRIILMTLPLLFWDPHAY
jgi:lipopolysaccharide/colanic/teichoic acid biosynthesis glycosyltransferase